LIAKHPSFENVQHSPPFHPFLKNSEPAFLTFPPFSEGELSQEAKSQGWIETFLTVDEFALENSGYVGIYARPRFIKEWLTLF